MSRMSSARRSASSSTRSSAVAAGAASVAGSRRGVGRAGGRAPARHRPGALGRDAATVVRAAQPLLELGDGGVQCRVEILGGGRRSRNGPAPPAGDLDTLAALELAAV